MYSLIAAVLIVTSCSGNPKSPSGGDKAHTPSEASDPDRPPVPRAVPDQNDGWASPQDHRPGGQGRIGEEELPRQSSPQNEENQTLGGCFDAPDAICETEERISSLTNQIRREAGRANLVISEELAWAARSWSEIFHNSGLAFNTVNAHRDFRSGATFRRFKQQFPSSKIQFLSENTAMSGGSSSDPGRLATVFTQMWRNSPGHYWNMVSTAPGVVGSGVYCGQRGCYATQIFGR